MLFRVIAKEGVQMSSFSTGIKLTAVFAIALAAVGLFQTMGAHGRVDLTEHELYTLSEGTHELVQNLDRGVTLKLFFSQEGTKDIVRLRQYEKRVAELLTEIESSNPDKIHFEEINPEPFSEEEDEAAAYGLTAAPIAPGQSVYFGIAAIPTPVDGEEEPMLTEDQDAEIIPFLQPDREPFLEYDMAQLIHKVGNPEKPVIGLLTGLEVDGGLDIMQRQQKQPWLAVREMKDLYDVQDIAPTAETLPDNLDVLVMIQPQTPSDALLYAIDQFALKGGRIIAFIDPLANTDQPNPMMGSTEKINGADWNRLFHAWGVELNPGEVVGDMNLALLVNQGQNQSPVRHIAIQNYTEANIAETPFTRQISQLNLATSGEWLKWSPQMDAAEVSQEGSGDTAEVDVDEAVETLSGDNLKAYEKLNTQIEPLLMTSNNSGLIDAEVFQPGSSIEAITNDFKSDGTMRNVGVVMSGTAVSAFPEGFMQVEQPDVLENDEVEPKPEHLSSGEINAILIADTDMLTDYLWVQIMGQFRGQSIAQPFADNGDFFLNTIEYMSGDQSLMSIRSRGTYSRPFTLVDEIRLAAEQKYREQEEQLNFQLAETEKKLAELQPADDNTVELTPDQQQALLDFQQERLSIRKSLRNVNLQLNQDIRTLGLKIKAVNIFLVPLLLFIFAVLFFSMRQKQMERAKISYLYNQ